MFPIYKREMLAYYTSPIGYIFTAVLLVLSGILFSFTTVWMRTVDTSAYFVAILFLFSILIPLLTMKQFSEERKSKTEQLLLTAPVSIFGIVFAKFFAAFTVFAGSFILSAFINFTTLAAVTEKELNLALIVGSSVGILLIGAAFIAVGVFMSSLTENQVIAAVTTFGVILFMLLFFLIPSFIKTPFIREVLRWFSVIDRYQYFTSGIFSLPAILYFFSLSVIFLFLTTRIYEMRRWN